MSAIEVKNASNNEHPATRVIEFIKNYLAVELDDRRAVVEELHVHHPYVKNGVDMRLVIQKNSNLTLHVYVEPEAGGDMQSVQSFSAHNMEDAYLCFARRLMAPDPADFV